jgi:ABC-type Mn2+/Zn2+ transport system ATPase subunit
MDAVIEIDDVVVSYRENIALKGVSMKVAAGEFVGIVGPNGAGKTTLLNLIAGSGRLQKGTVRVLGYRFTPRISHALRKRIGYVSQAQNIDPRMPVSVREATIVGRYGRMGLFKMPSKADWQIAADALKLVGISGLANRPIGHLSGGEQQRTAIARCLAQEPDIFLLDEPTASLDWRAKTEILDLIKMVQDVKKLTTLFVTHDLSSLPAKCDHLIMMKQGKVWGEGSAEEMLTDKNLSELYDMPVSGFPGPIFGADSGEGH